MIELTSSLAELIRIATRYPDEEIRVTFQGTNITVGFVKGPYGDTQHEAWTAWQTLQDNN